MNYGLIVVTIVLLSILMVPSLVPSQMLRITYVVPVFPSTVLRLTTKLVTCMPTSSLLSKTFKMLITLTLVSTVGVETHLSNTTLSITGSVNGVQEIELVTRSTVISPLMVLSTLFMKTLVMVHLLMVTLPSNNSSVFVNKLVTVVPLILLHTSNNGKNLV